MVQISFRISLDKEVCYSFVGDAGDLEFSFFGRKYGHISSQELEHVMGVDDIYTWFLNLVNVTIGLKNESYFALSSMERRDYWIEFFREEENLFINLVHAYRTLMMDDVCKTVINKRYDGEKNKQPVDFNLFCSTVIKTVGAYICEAMELNSEFANKDAGAELIEALDILKEQCNEVY